MNKCIECGIRDILIKHHVFGKKNDPDTIVYLCPNCHAKLHSGLLLFQNRASIQFNSWLESQEEQRYVGLSELMEMLDNFGYVPHLDGWEKYQSARETARQLYQSSPIGLWNYLFAIDRLDLWPE